MRKYETHYLAPGSGISACRQTVLYLVKLSSDAEAVTCQSCLSEMKKKRP